LAAEHPQQVWRDSYRVDPKALLLQSRSSKRARWGLSTLTGWDDVDTQIQALYTRFRAGEIVSPATPRCTTIASAPASHIARACSASK
jgi:hypothetical protein